MSSGSTCYLIIRLLCTLLLEAKSPDLILDHSAHLPVPVPGGATVEPELRCIYSLLTVG